MLQRIRLLRRFAWGIVLAMVVAAMVLSFNSLASAGGEGCIRPACGSGGDSECGDGCMCGSKGGSTNSMCYIRPDIEG